ncbi:Xaa-Pro peptidase family protein [Haloarchaeobius sp. FL176]|uniref:M24 family metallopeptidase n=1 Tax=Haloarchaeobius sp. FL176 TaxID=2967129 RepID=UPI0021498FB4|nr:Xaa-Pro peptidase family protein [Haloarchaeobius sp. FL176]
MTETAFERRTRACQQRLRDGAGDLAVLFPSRNLFYATGFDEEPQERHLFLFVPAEGDPTFLVPDLYGSQVESESWVEDVRTWSDGEDPVAAVEDVVADLSVPADGHVLVDDTMWALFTQDLEAALPDASFGLASVVFDELRVRKDEAELDALRRAGQLADEVSVALRELGEEVVGWTEAELAAEIESRLVSGGGESVSFDVIAGSGPNGAMPHHTHGDREIERGDPVVLDFGAYVDGYPGDQTRTVVFAGEPPERFAEVHGTVREALEAGVSAVEPGVTAESVDRAAREVIEDAGYGERFVHRTGHGVGLDVHEPPYIVDGNGTELEPGMVFSVEPGVYLDGEFGVRIEDLVVVTEDGCERLNESPHGWRVGDSE